MIVVSDFLLEAGFSQEQVKAAVHALQGKILYGVVADAPSGSHIAATFYTKAEAVKYRDQCRERARNILRAYRLGERVLLDRAGDADVTVDELYAEEEALEDRAAMRMPNFSISLEDLRLARFYLRRVPMPGRK